MVVSGSTRSARWVALAGAILLAGWITSSPAQGPAGPQRRQAQTRRAESRPADRRGWRGQSPTADNAELTEFIAQYLPELDARLKVLRKDNPDEARQLTQQVWWLWRRVRRYPPEIRKVAVEWHKLNVEIWTVARTARDTTDPAQRKESLERLRKLLRQQMDADQVLKEYDIKRLEAQLAEVREEVRRRRAERDKIIEERLARMLAPRPTATAPAPGEEARKSP